MSNALERDLRSVVEQREAHAQQAPRRWAQRFHLMPPVGWLNDPNGLYQAGGVFHAYFQYAPLNVDGGVKMWGHSTSRDLVSWTYEGCALVPDAPFDCHGVYSGSALVEGDRVSMFYTGSVKLSDPDGRFDYISIGRECNTVLVQTEDGHAFGEKRLLMTNADYPSDLTCHVRDPKVWRADAPCGRYLMVQGARCHVDAAAAAESVGEGTAAEEAAAASPRADLFDALHGTCSRTDQGEVLVFASDNLTDWRLQNRVTSTERFGFMWECPDYFELPRGSDEPAAKILSVSPQGLVGGAWERRNLYQSGYFAVTGDLCDSPELGEFHLWDAGFDFYAPQAFEAEDGRRILIGWMGMPDDPTYGNDPTVAEGWQHCFTIPREVTCGADGVVRQEPVGELAQARRNGVRVDGELHLDEIADACDIEVVGIRDGFSVLLGNELELVWDTDARDGARFEMSLIHRDRASAGCGRTVRWERVDRLDSVRILVDTSSVEVFVNGGELVMSTRWYPQARRCSLSAPGAAVSYWELAVPAACA